MVLPAALASKAACVPTFTGHYYGTIASLAAASERTMAIEASGPSTAGAVAKPW